jgi:hypothetical protein
LVLICLGFYLHEKASIEGHQFTIRITHVSCAECTTKGWQDVANRAMQYVALHRQNCALSLVYKQRESPKYLGGGAIHDHPTIFAISAAAYQLWNCELIRAKEGAETGLGPFHG